MVRRVLKTLRYRFLLPGWIRAAREQSATLILCYHRFENHPGEDPLRGMSLTPRAFARQLETLASLGPIVPLAEALGPSAGLRFVLTFDDGYADNLGVLVPLLEAARAPATVFCTADFVSGRLLRLPHDLDRGITDRAPLSPGELRDLAEHPWITIGAHGASHTRLDRYDPKVWEREVAEAKTELEALTGKSIEHFAYPFGARGDFDWTHGPAVLRAAGYRTICSNYGGWNLQAGPREAPVHLHRMPAIADDHPDRFLGWLFDPRNRPADPCKADGLCPHRA